MYCSSVCEYTEIPLFKWSLLDHPGLSMLGFLSTTNCNIIQAYKYLYLMQYRAGNQCFYLVIHGKKKQVQTCIVDIAFALNWL